MEKNLVRSGRRCGDCKLIGRQANGRGFVTSNVAIAEKRVGEEAAIDGLWSARRLRPEISALQSPVTSQNVIGQIKDGYLVQEAAPRRETSAPDRL